MRQWREILWKRPMKLSEPKKKTVLAEMPSLGIQVKNAIAVGAPVFAQRILYLP